MNKLIAISILLLIGCSPASPDESEITIGRPEKKADSLPKEPTTYPIPLGIWKSDKYANYHDFTDLPYEIKLTEDDLLFNKDKEIEYKKFTTVYGRESKASRGYWYKYKDTFYVRYLDATKGWMPFTYELDRGSLIGHDGHRWYRQQGK